MNDMVKKWSKEMLKMVQWASNYTSRSLKPTGNLLCLL